MKTMTYTESRSKYAEVLDSGRQPTRKQLGAPSVHHDLEDALIGTKKANLLVEQHLRDGARHDLHVANCTRVSLI